MEGKSKSYPKILLAVLGVFIGAGLFTFIYADGYSYFLNDPKACINCHIMQDSYDRWLHGPHHHTAVCNDCHAPHDSLVAKYWSKAENGFWHSKGFTFNDFHEPIQIREVNVKVVLNNCVRCHAGIHQDIGRSTEKPACLNCHREAGHRR